MNDFTIFYDWKNLETIYYHPKFGKIIISGFDNAEEMFKSELLNFLFDEKNWITH